MFFENNAISPNITLNYAAIYHVDWAPRFFLMLIGYGSIILPFYFLICFVQSRYSETDHNSRQTLLQKFLCAFAVGQLDYQPLNSEHQITSNHRLDIARDAECDLAKLDLDNNSPYTKTFLYDCFKAFTYFIGIQVTLVCVGFFQEKIMTRGYAQNMDHMVENKFEDAQFLVLANRLVGFMMAGIYFIYDYQRQPVHTPPIYIQSFASISNTISSWCQYEALKYVSFPTQTVCKASKVVPTMIMGRMLRKQRYSTVDYLMALVLIAGAATFFLTMNNCIDISKKSIEDSNIMTTHFTTTSGLILMFIYLVCDAFTPNFQKTLLEAKVSRCQMMFYTNAVSAFLCLATLLQHMTVFSSLNFVLSHNGIFTDCLILSIAGSLGQIFIYMTIDNFGPVALSVMMTVRQIFSIVLSSAYFAHPISLIGVAGLAVCFGSIFADLYRKYFYKKRQNEYLYK